VIADCTWNSPGVDPYRGTVAAAVARYNLPEPVRAVLVEKARTIKFDSILTITRDGARTNFGDAYAMRDMHYGPGRVCAGNVDRSRWSADHIERAFVYCSGGYCIAVPFICRNVTLLAPIAPQSGHAYGWPDTDKGGPAEDKAIRTVPEPGSLGLAAIALAILIWRFWK